MDCDRMRAVCSRASAMRSEDHYAALRPTVIPTFRWKMEITPTHSLCKLCLCLRETCICGKAVQRARASLSVFERSQRLNQLLPVQADRVRAPRAMERGAREREEALTPVNDKSRERASERDRVLALPCPALPCIPPPTILIFSFSLNFRSLGSHRSFRSSSGNGYCKQAAVS